MGPRRVTQAELRETFDLPPFRMLRIDAAEMGTNFGGGRKAWLATVERLADPRRDPQPGRRLRYQREPAEGGALHDEVMGPWGLRERELAADHGLQDAAVQACVHGGACGLHFVGPRVRAAHAEHRALGVHQVAGVDLYRSRGCRRPPRVRAAPAA